LFSLYVAPRPTGALCHTPSFLPAPPTPRRPRLRLDDCHTECGHLSNLGLAEYSAAQGEFPERFKAQLIRVDRAQLLTLARADLVAAMPEAVVVASETGCDRSARPAHCRPARCRSAAPTLPSRTRLGLPTADAPVCPAAAVRTLGGPNLVPIRT